MRKLPENRGTRKGSPNKYPAQAKENIIAVFTRIGGTSEMAKWAQDNLTEFYKLYAKLIPVESHISGKDGQPLVTPVINIAISQPDEQAG